MTQEPSIMATKPTMYCHFMQLFCGIIVNSANNKVWKEKHSTYKISTGTSWPDDQYIGENMLYQGAEVNAQLLYYSRSRGGYFDHNAITNYIRDDINERLS